MLYAETHGSAGRCSRRYKKSIPKVCRSGTRFPTWKRLCGASIKACTIMGAPRKPYGGDLRTRPLYPGPVISHVTRNRCSQVGRSGSGNLATGWYVDGVPRPGVNSTATPGGNSSWLVDIDTVDDSEICGAIAQRPQSRNLLWVLCPYSAHGIAHRNNMWRSSKAD
ncbi:hypothetical protein BC826DRAFT_418380 [Russula brevipes]|nr:hypothetical protein BC826DRAFT_418380 [Russula brevipes]